MADGVAFKRGGGESASSILVVIDWNSENSFESQGPTTPGSNQTPYSSEASVCDRSPDVARL